MSEPRYSPEVIEALARHLARLAGQNPDGLYKTAWGSSPAWHGYRSDALSVLTTLRDLGVLQASGSTPAQAVRDSTG